MRRLRVTVGLLLVVPTILIAQAPTPPPAAAPVASPLPIRRVVLYKAGVGYFEHLGKVRNRQNVTIRFTSAQLDDVLKSLTTMDLGQGQITGISYNSVAPLQQRLGALRLPLEDGATSTQLLMALRGAHVEVSSGAGVAVGRILGIEQRQQTARDGESKLVDLLAVITDAGDLRTFDVTPALHVRIVEKDLRDEVGHYLDLVGSTREQDSRGMTIATNGTGERSLFVSYVSEVPVWKSTYRLVLASKSKPLLQGWAIVDNTIGEDWENVELSLVAGVPQSFIQHISQPYYSRRPVVAMPSSVQLTPQTHEATVTVGQSDAPRALDDVTLRPGGRGVGPGSAGGTGGGVYRSGVPGGVVGGVVGGLAEAPPAPVYERMNEMTAAASGAELGDLFDNRIKEPVTLRKNQSALVPIINNQIDIEKVALWNRNSGSGRPLRAVWLTNTTGLTLDGGSMSIVEADAFAGEGLIEPLKPGERRLVSYGADLGMLVDAKSDSTPRRVARVRVRDGIVTEDREERINWTYRVRNENSTATTLIIEHAMRNGWKLADGQKPAESTADTHRFRVVVEPKGEATLVVRDVLQVSSRVGLTDVNDAWIAAVAQGGLSVTSLQSALKPVLDKRAELAAIERQVASLQQKRDEIARDQERLRENMKALRGSAEEKQLLQRYTRQLDEEETQLDTLKRDLATATAARDKARGELSDLIASVSFELGSQP